MTVNTSISANGTQSNRSGTITVLGTVGNKTITRTISVSQQWGATLRIMYTNSGSGSDQLYNKKSNVEDTVEIQTNLSSAADLQISYPFMGGSNICNYYCEKLDGIFYFTLNTIYIYASDQGTDIDDTYWDIPNALFVPINSTTLSYFYTPVIRFSYNPTTGVITIIDTLYSLGGAAFLAENPESESGENFPDREKMFRTGVIDDESNGYGAFAAHYSSTGGGGTIHIYWPMFRWYPKIVQTFDHGSRFLDVTIVGQCSGIVNSPDRYPKYQNLSKYDWRRQDYVGIFIDSHGLIIRDEEILETQDEFYHKDMYTEISY